MADEAAENAGAVEAGANDGAEAAAGAAGAKEGAMPFESATRRRYASSPVRSAGAALIGARPPMPIGRS